MAKGDGSYDDDYDGDDANSKHFLTKQYESTKMCA